MITETAEGHTTPASPSPLARLQRRATADRAQPPTQMQAIIARIARGEGVTAAVEAEGMTKRVFDLRRRTDANLREEVEAAKQTGEGLREVRYYAPAPEGWQKKYLDARRAGMNRGAAAKAAGVSTTTVLNYERKDKQFGAACDAERDREESRAREKAEAFLVEYGKTGNLQVSATRVGACAESMYALIKNDARLGAKAQTARKTRGGRMRTPPFWQPTLLGVLSETGDEMAAVQRADMAMRAYRVARRGNKALDSLCIEAAAQPANPSDLLARAIDLHRNPPEEELVGIVAKWSEGLGGGKAAKRNRTTVLLLLRLGRVRSLQDLTAERLTMAQAEARIPRREIGWLGWEPTTLYTSRTMLARFTAWLYAEGMIAADPMPRVPPVTLSAPRKRRKVVAAPHLGREGLKRAAVETVPAGAHRIGNRPSRKHGPDGLPADEQRRLQDLARRLEKSGLTARPFSQQTGEDYQEVRRAQRYWATQKSRKKDAAETSD